MTQTVELADHDLQEKVKLMNEQMATIFRELKTIKTIILVQ